MCLGDCQRPFNSLFWRYLTDYNVICWVFLRNVFYSSFDLCEMLLSKLKVTVRQARSISSNRLGRKEATPNPKLVFLPQFTCNQLVAWSLGWAPPFLLSGCASPLPVSCVYGIHGCSNASPRYCKSVQGKETCRGTISSYFSCNWTLEAIY